MSFLTSGLSFRVAKTEKLASLNTDALNANSANIQTHMCVGTWNESATFAPSLVKNAWGSATFRSDGTMFLGDTIGLGNDVGFGNNFATFVYGTWMALSPTEISVIGVVTTALANVNAHTPQNLFKITFKINFDTTIHGLSTLAVHTVYAYTDSTMSTPIGTYNGAVFEFFKIPAPLF